MTEIVPCLLRIGDNCKKYKLFKLTENQVTIGRSGDVTYCIMSNMISRCHAIIKHNEESKSWTITDLKSLNGSFVNGRKLSPSEPYKLVDGDMVQLGIPIVENQPAEFLFKFHSALKVRTKSKRLKTEDETSQGSLEQTTENSYSEEEEKKRKKPIPFNEREEIEAAYRGKLAEMEKLLKEKEAKEEEVKKQLELERKEKENRLREVEELRLKEQEQLKLKEEAILKEIKKKEEQLEKEKENIQKKMEENLKEKESALLSKLEAQKDALLSEKAKVEESLQQEMNKKIEEKNKELEEKLLEEKQRLEKVLEQKEKDQKQLEKELDTTKEESRFAQLQAMKAKDDILTSFADLMESELQCPICNELIINATSLNCSHVFCTFCIGKWMKVKKICPTCRNEIFSQNRAFALDNYIEKMVEQFNEELKQRRKEVIAYRKIEEQNALAPPVAPPARTTTRGRGRGRRNAARTRTTTARAAAPAVVVQQATPGGRSRATPQVTATSTTPTVIDLTTIDAPVPSTSRAADSVVPPATATSSSSPSYRDSSCTDTDSEDESYDGYYGGYGRCFRCGESGHWANGCPYY